MRITFISDLHISESQPEITRQFIDFLEKSVKDTDALYILGDLFEYWIGDDNPNLFYNPIILALNNYTAGGSGIPTYFIHGNRDFLIGDIFAKKTGIKILKDPSIIKINDEKIMISHGDIFCTDDCEYQITRKLTRDPEWQKMMLKKSIAERINFARESRDKSKDHTKYLDENITDVNQDEINKTFQKNNITKLIHGHTHKPAIHDTLINDIPHQRLVLGDWYEQGSVLNWDESGPNLVTLDRL
jgi:UDP-2,3-diacylglucosamine hydrolase